MADNFLPLDKLPDCWNDEARINVLFAPFRDKSVNPKDWDSKLEFWRNLIYTYCVHNKVYIFTSQNLTKRFVKNGRSPACLGVVIDQMYKNNEIKPLHIFQQKPSETWSNWITDNLIKKPVVWSFTKIKDSFVPADSNVCYVHLNAIESEANTVLDCISANIGNKVIDIKSLAETLKFNNMEQLQLILHFLYCKRKIFMKTFPHKDNTTILLKLCDTNNIEGITDRDIDIYTLKQSEKTLLEDIEKLEKQAIQLICDTKAFLSKKQRQSAKMCLRKKREVEKCIEKRANTLHNIQTLLSRVEDVDADAQTLDTYKAALTRLRTTFNETGLTEESVSNTMLELEEVLEIHDEIQASLSKQDTTIDSDIENELADLLKDDGKDDVGKNKPDSNVQLDKLEEKFADLDIELPSPPKTFINQTKISL